ncbi:juvenile hormone esterase-like [Vanessa cardui]|uniref:juvenile hormone esterase-like n=1 Tax=Vanessa cardui TaxID=171605 RepID=UPI001F13A721|nr:juvenile hormone esterase-like [Vanessa cardui]
MYWLVIINLGLFSLVTCDDRPSRLVNLTQGPVRGYKDLDLDIFVFYGIPYATAPTGHDKFKAPLPPPVWTEPFEAINKDIICPQSTMLTMLTNTVVREDCLFANVYVPETNKEKLPVVVHFHAVAFAMGWSDIKADGNLIKSKEIIQVSFNHRLGAHGFLCLGTKDVPGNAGMKDQVALLRWVKNNIGNFGGNPDDVTLFGEETGSASVDLMTISKMAQGLFKRVIVQSGVSTTPYSVQIDPIENALLYADYFKFENGDNIYELEFFLKNLSPRRLNSKHTMNREDSTFLMSPCVERDVGEERFLDDNPVNIIKSGNYKKVPMLYGYGEIDGQFRIPALKFWGRLMNKRFIEFLPGDLQFECQAEKLLVAKAVKAFYFGDKVIGKDTMPEYVKYFTDITFAYPTLRSAKLHVESGHNKIYMFVKSKAIYDIPDTIPLSKNTSDKCSMSFGALNEYLKELRQYKYVENLKTVRDAFRETLISFITEGEPIIPGLRRWKPVDINLSPQLYIDGSFKLKKSLRKKMALFWDEIYQDYYVYPSAPPAPPPRNINIQKNTGVW